MLCLQAKSPFALLKSNSFVYNFSQFITIKYNRKQISTFFLNYLNSYDMRMVYENTKNKGSNFRPRLSVARVT